MRVTALLLPSVAMTLLFPCGQLSAGDCDSSCASSVRPGLTVFALCFLAPACQNILWIMEVAATTAVCS